MLVLSTTANPENTMDAIDFYNPDPRVRYDQYWKFITQKNRDKAVRFVPSYDTRYYQ